MGFEYHRCHSARHLCLAFKNSIIYAILNRIGDIPGAGSCDGPDIDRERDRERERKTETERQRDRE